MVFDEFETGESGNGMVTLVTGGMGDMVELAESTSVEDLLGGVCFEVEAVMGETLVGEGVGDLFEVDRLRFIDLLYQTYLDLLP